MPVRQWGTLMLQFPLRDVFYDLFGLFIFVCLFFILCGGRRFHGQRVHMKGRGDDGVGVHDVKLTQNHYKVKSRECTWGTRKYL